MPTPIPTAPGKPAFDDLDVSAREFWSQTAPERETTFAELRRRRPVSWQRPIEASLMPLPPEPGYWAVVRHADIVEVSRNSEVFISSRGVHMEPVPEDIIEASLSFLGMDGEKHAKIRGLVRAAFTPRAVNRLIDSIEANSVRIVGELAEAGSGCDFVRNCAVKLPLVTISDMMGVPDSQRDAVRDAADAMVSVTDPTFLGDRNPLEVMVGNQMFLHAIAVEMAQDRRRSPQDDIMTNLVEAEVNGERLTDAEIGAFMILMSVAGNDTTRQTTSLTMRALTEFPAQRAWLTEDFDGRIDTAIEEFVRWSTPVMTFSRTASRDYELAGQLITAGDKVVMMYSSGNRDETVFDDPHVFDLNRRPNHHIAFGGGGAHYCLGANLARAQLRALFRQLLSTLPDIQAGEPLFLGGNFIHGVASMPCHF
ncbi:cytochrome P450 [Arthrobacter sp. SLBN-53]|uniref:cytochrome P450 n=1 Tax=Arthrobacter sp. SLBN-53 TaxID=2768412 RepID=UPI00115350AF|nr:cytochrome P450 [Arthrobacter sp. SLBN-53]TQK30336.1 cytochrome P450 [Arthrobacter sp. SLBN-53]